MFEYYSDLTFRSGQSGASIKILPTYNVPSQVTRRILIDLTPSIKNSEDEAFTLTDHIWEQPYLEFHLLAAIILGMIPSSSPEPVIQRINTWVQESDDVIILETIADQGLKGLREAYLLECMQLIEDSLNHAADKFSMFGLKAIPPLLEMPEFENLPSIFRLLNNYIQTASPDMRNYLLEVSRSLAKNSPQETAYFLRQILIRNRRPDTIWLIRRCIDLFPTESQIRLRNELLDQ
jgi:hypothetical protein